MHHHYVRLDDAVTGVQSTGADDWTIWRYSTIYSDCFYLPHEENRAISRSVRLVVHYKFVSTIGDECITFVSTMRFQEYNRRPIRSEIPSYIRTVSCCLHYLQLHYNQVDRSVEVDDTPSKRADVTSIPNRAPEAGWRDTHNGGQRERRLNVLRSMGVCAPREASTDFDYCIF